jgi:hypothetical protein
MPDGLLPGAGGVDGVQGQGYFDEFFAVHGMMVVLSSLVIQAPKVCGPVGYALLPGIIALVGRHPINAVIPDQFEVVGSTGIEQIGFCHTNQRLV